MIQVGGPRVGDPCLRCSYSGRLLLVGEAHAWLLSLLGGTLIGDEILEENSFWMEFWRRNSFWMEFWRTEPREFVMMLAEWFRDWRKWIETP